MAYFPCDIGNHPTPLRNINVYLGLLGGGPDVRRTGRICLTHWAEVEDHLAQYEVVAQDGAAPFSNEAFICPACRQPVDQGGVRAFFTAYPTKNERKDYWLQFHINCDRPAWLSLLVSSFR